MTLTSITEFDIVYISYDEPNADDNWADLLEKCPWAKRSHGVYGSDAAHKAAASLAETVRVITVDADNIVDPTFFNLELDMSKIGKSDVISWAAKNEINGLAYGNGGIKCWPVHVIQNMRTHEAAPENDSQSQVDFCWNVNYVQMNNVYSHVYNNASPQQAWRAGFREGVKMTLENGDVVGKSKIKNLNQKNLQRLLVWQSVGMDVQNGLWAIYGARFGCIMANLRRDEWDWTNVRDFEWLNQYWHNEIVPSFAAIDHINPGNVMCDRTGYTWNQPELETVTEMLGQQIRNELKLEIADLNVQASKFFKQVYVNPARVHPLSRELDVINELEQ